MVGGVEQFVYYLIGNGSREEAIAHIASLVDRFVEAALLGFREFAGRRFRWLFHPRTTTPVKYTPISAS
jgi:hypothetical protein